MKNLNEMSETDLVSEIKIHDDAYWKKGQPIISDADYDRLVEKLKSINPNHPLINKVHTPSVSSDGKVVHKEPMRSLAKVYTIEELIKWCVKVGRSNDEIFVVEFKFDGCSASLEEGVLATRGDGDVGEDITSKLPIIDILTSDSNVRGEIVMRKDVFKRYQKVLDFKNTRNAVGGLLNRNVVNTKHGKILALIPFDATMFHFSLAEIKGFASDPTKFNDIIELANESPFPTDGLVIKLIDMEYANSLGATSHHAKGEMAFKFPNPTDNTVLQEIEWSIGKHTITPIGKVEPIIISGNTIKRVNLHNYAYLIINEIQIGDTLIIERSGDVIPNVYGVIPAEGTEDNREDIILDLCPGCGSKTIYDSPEKIRKVIQLRKQLKQKKDIKVKRKDIIFNPEMLCSNSNCPEMILRRLEDSVIRIGIKRLRSSTLKKMINQLGVRTLLDIFALSPTDIKKLDGFGDRSSENLFKEIQNVGGNPVYDWRILASLNLVGIGTSLSKILLKQYSLDDLRNMTVDSFKDIEGIGAERAAVLVNGFVDNSEYIDILLAILPVISSRSMDEESSNKVKICFTGKFPKKKSEYYALLGEGYEVSEKLSKDTQVLVVADPSKQSNKMKTAIKRGTKIMSLQDLSNKIGVQL